MSNDSNFDYLGGIVTGIPSDSWNSIQAFASDYYLGVNGTPPETPVVAQLSNIEDSTLWQFVTATPDEGQGVYALRSKYADGQYCLHNNCVGPEICRASSTVSLCATDAGQFQVYNSSSTSGGVIFVLYASYNQSALFVDGSSSQGDLVNSTTLAGNSDEVGFSFAIHSEEPVDAAANPVTFTPKYTSLTSKSWNSTPETNSQTTVPTTVPAASATGSDANTGNMAVATAVTNEARSTMASMSATATPAQQTGSASRHRRLSTKMVLAGIACLSLLVLSV